MQNTSFKLVRAGRKTAWFDRGNGEHLADFAAQNICGEFDSLKAAMEAARLRLAADRKAIFFICDAKGKVEGKMLDELVQRRRRERQDVEAKLLVAAFVSLMCVTYAQFLGFQLVPRPLYFFFVTLVLAVIVCCIVAFPGDTKIISIVLVVLLIAVGYWSRR